MRQSLIKDLPRNERPRERLLQNGAGALSHSELLAIILRTGSKQKSVIELALNVLNEMNGIRNMNDATIAELTSVHGVGTSKAVQILAAVEFGKRVEQANRIDNSAPFIKTPEDCYRLLAGEMVHLRQENFVVLLLDIHRRLIHRQTIFVGTLTGSVVHPREIFRAAVKASAASIICVHNHPSGCTVPSDADIDATERLIEAGDLMSIPLVDHVIIAEDSFFSMKEEGYIWTHGSK